MLLVVPILIMILIQIMVIILVMVFTLILNMVPIRIVVLLYHLKVTKQPWGVAKCHHTCPERGFDLLSLLSRVRKQLVPASFTAGDRYSTDNSSHGGEMVLMTDIVHLWSKNKSFRFPEFRFGYVWPFNSQMIQFEFSPTSSCVSLTRSTTSSEWELFGFDKMDVDYFQILSINVTFYLQYVWRLIWSMLIKNVKNEYNRYRRLGGLRVVVIFFDLQTALNPDHLHRVTVLWY